ncbi:hypothetical protein ACMFMF_011914 [Clarireedia jacksonii]
MDRLVKMCITCGRKITWRKKWEKNWPTITHCSASCRSHKIKPHSLDTLFESKILALLSSRKHRHGRAAAVTCEEVEGAVLADLRDSISRKAAVEEGGGGVMADADESGNGSGNAPPPQLQPKRTRERCRQAARRLVARGEIVVLRDGKVVDASFAKGVMELRFPP